MNKDGILDQYIRDLEGQRFLQKRSFYNT